VKQAHQGRRHPVEVRSWSGHTLFPWRFSCRGIPVPPVTSEGEALGSESLGFVFSWDRREGHEGAERTEPNGPGMGIKEWQNESREPRSRGILGTQYLTLLTRGTGGRAGRERAKRALNRKGRKERKDNLFTLCYPTDPSFAFFASFAVDPRCRKGHRSGAKRQHAGRGKRRRQNR